MKLLFKFVLLSLATFRLTQLISKEDGPYNIFSNFRFWLVKNSEKNKTIQTISDGVHCPYCLSVWLSFIIMLMPDIIIKGLAIAGVVFFLEEIALRDEE